MIIILKVLSLSCYLYVMFDREAHDSTVYRSCSNRLNLAIYTTSADMFRQMSVKTFIFWCFRTNNNHNRKLKNQILKTRIQSRCFHHFIAFCISCFHFSSLITGSFVGREKKTGCARDWKRKNPDAALLEAKNKTKRLRYSFVAVNQTITEA